MRFVHFVLFLAFTGIACADAGGEIADGINDVICLFVRLIWLVTGSLMALVIIFAGVKWLVSGGDAGARASAKTFIVSAFVGLIIIFTAVPVVDYLVEGTLGYKFACGFFPEINLPGSGAGSEEEDRTLSILSAGEPDPMEDNREFGFRDIVVSDLGEGPLYVCLVVEELGGDYAVEDLEVAAYLDREGDPEIKQTWKKTLGYIAAGGTARMDCGIDPELAGSIRDDPGEYRITGEIDPAGKFFDAGEETGEHKSEKFFNDITKSETCPEICSVCCVPGTFECHIDVDGGGAGIHVSGDEIIDCNPLGGTDYRIVTESFTDSGTMNNPRCGRCEGGALPGEYYDGKLCEYDYDSGGYVLAGGSRLSSPLKLRTLSVGDESDVCGLCGLDSACFMDDCLARGECVFFEGPEGGECRSCEEAGFFQCPDYSGDFIEQCEEALCIDGWECRIEGDDCVLDYRGVTAADLFAFDYPGVSDLTASNEPSDYLGDVVNVWYKQDNWRNYQPLRDKVNELTEGETDDYGKLKSIAIWVHGSKTYKRSAAETVIESFEASTGHCHTSAMVTTAMLRLAGIPARYLRTVHDHAYAEAYIDGKWMGIDTTPDEGNWKSSPVLSEISVPAYEMTHEKVVPRDVFQGSALVYPRSSSKWVCYDLMNPEDASLEDYGSGAKPCYQVNCVFYPLDIGCNLYKCSDVLYGGEAKPWQLSFINAGAGYVKVPVYPATYEVECYMLGSDSDMTAGAVVNVPPGETIRVTPDMLERKGDDAGNFEALIAAMQYT
ncbi:MAG: hypothetical protein JW724_01720 [Candidatus Altiarchaeota archaeon]|nr:hypothetical protein [Candidatus Altiarchaeota archaeon]